MARSMKKVNRFRLSMKLVVFMAPKVQKIIETAKLQLTGLSLFEPIH